MSYVTELNTSRQIAEAARSLDILQAAQQHKLPADAEKHALLARVMKEHAARFEKLAQNQSFCSPEEFFKRAFERVRQMRAESALIVKMRREKRERDEAERAAALEMMSATAA